MANKITIKVNGIPEALAKLKRYQFKKKEQIKQELMIGGRKVEGLAKRIASSKGVYKTGVLIGSITSDESDIEFLVVRVGSDKYYAVFQEFGTIYITARPFLFPAFFAYENDIVKAIGRVLRKDIGIG